MARKSTKKVEATAPVAGTPTQVKPVEIKTEASCACGGNCGCN